MWRLSKSFRFEAAHHLPSHDGKCRRVHGHSWALMVEVQGVTLVTTGPKVAMLQDYGDISTAVNPLLDQYLDHWDLNVSTGLDNPTSEALARWVYDQLKPVLPLLHAITIQETCTSEARYEP